MRKSAFVMLPFLMSCATGAAPTPALVAPPATEPAAGETHLRELHQLTFGGENAEAYFRFDGQAVSMQRRAGDADCDRIYTLPLFENGALVSRPEPKQVSSGKGATTCSYFFPGGQELLYASTHLGGDSCPAKPDMSHGYVWALYPSYDIFKANADGSHVTRLTDTPGYDAEGTVCGKDGSIVFTSVRDGDVDLYRMDRDGKNVKRLTFDAGYDGGAFFNADCSKIVWRASRPKPGPELDSYKELLGQGLVRPTQLELYIANADGSDPRQITYLHAASFAPFWFPGRERIIFSSNYGDPQGREFDLWAVNADGTQLERITRTPGFDGFPMFSPDGQWLAFSSNRATAEGQHDTNLFIARWDEHAPDVIAASAADRIQRDATWLADPVREGRGIGTAGLEAAGAYLEKRFAELGLAPLGDAGSYRAHFDVMTGVKAGGTSALTIAGEPIARGEYVPLAFSGQGQATGKAVLAGYGLQDPELGIDDFKGLSVQGKIVIARRFSPESDKLSTTEAQRRAGDLRKKAFTAKSLGAKGLIIVDWPAQPTAAGPGTPAGHEVVAGAGEPPPSEAPLPELEPIGPGDAGIPVLVVKRAALERVWPRLLAKRAVALDMRVALDQEHTPAFNVVGRIVAPHKVRGGPIILGAHYDHLGYGGRDSLAPDQHVPHLGADDNASGTTVLLEIARQLSARRESLQSDVVIAAFSGEEAGLLGSSALVASKPAWLQGSSAMLNFDMVGRMRGNHLEVLGSETAPEWSELVQRACASAAVSCKLSGDGYGPSDQMSFYAAGLPVLHFFTGAHADYHKPTDSAAQLNAAGMAQVAALAAELSIAVQSTPLHYRKVPAPLLSGDARSSGASLGTVPDYSGPVQGRPGVLLSDVRPGGGADKAGMRRGDILVKVGKYDVRSVQDLMFVLMQAKPGETVTSVVVRDGRELKLETTFQAGRRR
jgi:Tol biopolymer transport system component